MVQYVSTTTTHNKQPTSSNLKGSAWHLGGNGEGFITSVGLKADSAGGASGRLLQGSASRAPPAMGSQAVAYPGFETRADLEKNFKAQSGII